MKLGKINHVFSKVLTGSIGSLVISVLDLLYLQVPKSGLSDYENKKGHLQGM
jgi:hypothetical protein